MKYISMVKPHQTTIVVDTDVRDKLKEKGKKGDTYNNILKKMLGMSLVLIFIGFTSADCGGNYSGYLEVSPVDDYNAGQTVHARVKTNISNQGVLRNVDIFLVDDNNEQLGKVLTQFNPDSLETSLDFNVNTNDQVLNQQYRVKVDLRVYNASNPNDILCGQISYSNWFYIRSNRTSYTESPFYVTINTPYPQYPFFTTQRKCNSDGSRCVELNVSGMLPSNDTSFLPVLKWSANDSLPPNNLSVSVNDKYEGAFLMFLAGNITSCQESLGKCNAQLVNDTLAYQGIFANIQSFQAQINQLTGELSDKKVELVTYQNEHPYKTVETIGMGWLLGIASLIIYIYFSNKRATTDTRQDVVD